MQIGALTLEKLMCPDREKNVQIASGSAAQASLALAGKPDAGAILYSGRDIHGKRALASYSPGTGA